MKYIIASNNKSKRAELQRILEQLGIEVLTAREAGFEPVDPVEDGETFAENAMIKAKAFVALTGMPTIADDSGLCVDALDGRPGVYSARYGGEADNDSQAGVDRVLRELEGVPEEQRGAHFCCAMCCLYPDGSVITAEGRCDGHIGFERDGEGGFGYDPIFISEEGASFGTMTKEQKDAVSHRGRALRELAKKLAERKTL